MASVSMTQEISAPKEKVFAVFANPSQRPQWLTLHDGWRSDPPAALVKGTTFTEKCTVMGMTNTIDWLVEEFDAPHSLTITGKGLAGAQITFVLAVSGEGSSSTAQIDAEFTGAMVVGAIGTAIERSAKKEVVASLEKLSALVG